MTKTFKAGDVVRYSAAFLRSIGCHTGPHPWAVGVVQEISEWGVARIEWDHPDIPKGVHTRALILASEVWKEPT